VADFQVTFGVALIAIGVFLTLFSGLYVKRKEVGGGADTPEKRTHLYAAIGIGSMFIGGGIVFLVLGP